MRASRASSGAATLGNFGASVGVASAESPKSETCPSSASRVVLAASSRAVSSAASFCARFPAIPSSAPHLISASKTRRFTCLRIHALGQIEQIGKSPGPLPRLDDVANRCLPDALDRRETETNRASDDRKIDQRLVDIGRQNLDPDLLRLVDIFHQFVGLVFHRRHQRSQILQRMVRLEVGGLIGNPRVRGSVCLVKRISGKRLDVVEEPLRQRPIDIRCRRGACDELLLIDGDTSPSASCR